jgi:penicillin-binding protein 1A
LPKNDLGLSTALGGLTFGVTQTELAAAYGTIANLGYYNESKFYTKVVDREGVVVLDKDAVPPKQVLKEANAYIVTDMMRGVVNGYGSYRQTGSSARFRNSSMPIAGKTGTSSETRDLTFVGYTPYYLGSVWLGFDDGTTSMAGITQQNEHMAMWRYIMEKVHENLPIIEFPRPENIHEIQVCRDSGLLPTNDCINDPRGSRVVTELFMAGTQPQDYCDAHVTTQVCSVSGKLPNQYCPPSVITYRSGIVRREPYTGSGYVEDRAYEISGVGSEYCNVHTENNASVFPWNGNGGFLPEMPSALETPLSPPNDSGMEESIGEYSGEPLFDENLSEPPVQYR